MLSDFLKKRHSIRSFEDKKVSLSLIKEILHEACLAPSAKNFQPWRFIIIENKEMLKKLSDNCKESLLEHIASTSNSSYKMFEKTLKDPSYNIFYNAPSLVMIGGNKDWPTLVEDCSLFASYFMLLSAEKNLGTCWIGFAKLINDKALKKEIGITNDFEVVASIIIGYPKTLPSKKHERKEPIIINTIS